MRRPNSLGRLASYGTPGPIPLTPLRTSCGLWESEVNAIMAQRAKVFAEDKARARFLRELPPAPHRKRAA